MERAKRSSDEQFPLPLGIAWGVLTAATCFVVTYPLCRAAAGILFLGPIAYFRDGVRLLDAKPARYSTGDLVSTTWIAILFAVGSILTFLLVGLLLQWGYRKWWRK